MISPIRQYCRASVLKPPEQIENRQQNSKEVADGVLPGIAQIPDPCVPDEVDQSRSGGERSRDDCGTVTLRKAPPFRPLSHSVRAEFHGRTGRLFEAEEPHQAANQN